MGTRCDLVGDDVEMQLHGFTITVRQHKGSAGSTLRADCAKDPGRLRALAMCGLRSDTFSGPTIGELVLLAHPHLVLEPQLYGCIRREPLADFCHKGWKLFKRLDGLRILSISFWSSAHMRKAHILQGAVDRIVRY